VPITSSPDLTAVARVVSLVLGSVLILASFAILGYVVRSFLGLRRRKEDEQPEVERPKARVSWTDYVLLFLAAFSVVMVARWAMNQLARGGDQAPSAVEGRVEPGPIAHEPPTRSVPSPGLVGISRIDFPRWGLLTGLAVSFAAAALLLLYVLAPRTLSRAGPAQEVGEIARATAEQLEHGADIGGSVVACYRDMCAALADRLKIGASMTPREFVGRLSETGFAVHDVSTLTLLFEKVRYGHEILAESERARAREALRAIQAQAKGSAP